MSSSDNAALGVAISTSFEVEKWIGLLFKKHLNSLIFFFFMRLLKKSVWLSPSSDHILSQPISLSNLRAFRLILRPQEEKCLFKVHEVVASFRVQIFSVSVSHDRPEF